MIKSLARSVLFAAVPGTTRRETAAVLTVTGTSPTTVTITLASVVPELTTGSDGPNLNRSSFRPFNCKWRNPMAPGVLVAQGGCLANAHRWVAYLGPRKK